MLFWSTSNWITYIFEFWISRLADLAFVNNDFFLASCQQHAQELLRNGVAALLTFQKGSKKVGSTISFIEY